MSDKLRVFIEEGSDYPFITTDSEVVANIVSLDDCLGWLEWLYPRISAAELKELEDIKKLVANVGFSLEVIEVCAGEIAGRSCFRDRVGTIINSGGLDI